MVWDPETGLYHTWARPYDPKTGRWESQDPLGFGAGDANLYRFVANQPTDATDPTGNYLIIDPSTMAQWRAQFAQWGLTPYFYRLPSGRMAVVVTPLDRLRQLLANTPAGPGYDWQRNVLRALNSTGTSYDIQANADMSIGNITLSAADHDQVRDWQFGAWAGGVTAYRPPVPSELEEFLTGLKHGSYIVMNALTFGSDAELDEYVKELIKENGGLYVAADVAATTGAVAMVFADVGSLVQIGGTAYRVLAVGGGKAVMQPVGSRQIVVAAAHAIETDARMVAVQAARRSTGTAGARATCTAVVKVNGGVPGNTTPSKRSTIAGNKAKGDAFEKQLEGEMRQTHTDVASQVTVKTPSGTKTRLDLIGKEQGTGTVVIKEGKSSATAPLTPNQAKAFPELEYSGGVVVGKGKPGFPGGTVIPPTKVGIVRPK